VEQSVEYRDDLSQRYDPLQLMDLVESICNNQVGMTSIAVRSALLDDYYLMRQEGSSIYEFYDRVLNHVAKMKKCGVDSEKMPEDLDMVQHFVKRLNNKNRRIQYFKTNHLVNKLSKITNLAELMSEWEFYTKHIDMCQIDKDLGEKEVTETAFMSSGKGSNKKQKKNHDTEVKNTKNTKRKLNCWNCNGNHLRHECTKPENKEIINANREKFLANKKKGKGGANTNDNGVAMSGVTGVNSDLSLYPHFFFVLLDSQASSHLFHCKEILPRAGKVH
jgi:hypothetical protein